jgi:hypothetical protein
MTRPGEFVLTDDMRLENVMAMHSRGELEPPTGPKRVLTLVADELAALRKRVAKIAGTGLLLDALDGVGVPKKDAVAFEKAGLAIDHGSRHLWNRDELAKMDAHTLLRFYLDLKGQK